MTITLRAALIIIFALFACTSIGYAIGRQVAPRDHFPVFNNPNMLTVREANKLNLLHPNDAVIGVSRGSEAKAYPVAIMGVHELGNDVIDSVPIAVGWWPLCQTAIVYSREVNGRTLDFGHAGILYQQSYVMYDKQTNSLWVHVTGKAEEGPLKGTQLEIIPSTVTTWRDWSLRHPETLVLEGSRHDGFMGSYGAMAGRSEEIGLVVVLRGKAQLYPYKVLASEPIINSHINTTPVLVVHNKAEMSTYTWSRDVVGRVLTFDKVRKENSSQDLVFTDNETGSLWSWIKGASIAGPLEGTVLKQLPAHPIVIERFPAFYPEGDVFSP